MSRSGRKVPSLAISSAPIRYLKATRAVVWPPPNQPELIAPEQAAGELRRDVAHELDRLARVVLDDAVDFLDRLAALPQLDRAQLQAFAENVGRMRHRAGDVDPVHIDGEEADQARALRSGMDRRVHDRVVEMLALHGRMVAQHHVAMVQALAPVDRK